MEPSDLENALTLPDDSSSKFALATSSFLLRVSDLYGGKAPFLAADCATKALTLNSQQSTKNYLKPLSKKFQKLETSICSRCKTFLVIGQNATSSWRSSAASRRKFGGMKRLCKIAKRRDSGIRLTKSQNRIYARYLKTRAVTNGMRSRLIITCGTCGFDSATPLGGSANQKRPRDAATNQNCAGADSIASIKTKKKKGKRRGKDSTILDSSRKLESLSGLASAQIKQVSPTFAQGMSTMRTFQRRVVTSTPKLSTPTPVAVMDYSGSGQTKKKIKSRLERLLAEEEAKKLRNSSASASGLASFLESL